MRSPGRDRQASSAALYPPASPPTPEDERCGGGGTIGGKGSGGGGRLFGASPGKGAKAAAAELACEAARVPTEAHARAEQWRAEASCGLRQPQLLFEDDAPLGTTRTTCALPTWVVAAYMEETGGSRAAGCCSAGDGSAAMVPCLLRVC